MNPLERLKELGLHNDQCYVAILNWFAENPNRRVNSTELSLMGFKRYKKGQRVWVNFSPSCVERKARKLAELGLLERGYDTSHHAWYLSTGEAVEPVRKIIGYKTRVIEGVPHAIPIYE